MQASLKRKYAELGSDRQRIEDEVAGNLDYRDRDEESSIFENRTGDTDEEDWFS